MRYIIESDSMKLVPFEDMYISDTYLGWLNNHELMKFSRHSDTEHTRDSCKKYIRSFDFETSFIWAIFSSQYGHVGNINAFLNSEKNSADFGLLIGSEQTGKGFGFSSWIMLSFFFFKELKVGWITGGCNVENIKMLRIMEKSGMKVCNNNDKEKIVRMRISRECFFNLLTPRLNGITWKAD